MLLFGYESDTSKSTQTEHMRLINLSESSIDCTLEEFERVFAFFKDIYEKIQDNHYGAGELVFESQVYCKNYNTPNIIVVIRPECTGDIAHVNRDGLPERVSGDGSY